jgi:hypothetical protein
VTAAIDFLFKLEHWNIDARVSSTTIIISHTQAHQTKTMAALGLTHSLIQLASQNKKSAVRHN